MRNILLLGICLLCGCGSTPPAVTGIVMLDGKPLPDARVLFIPQGATIGQGGDGVTDANGKFEVAAFYSSNPKCLPPGKYKVVASRLIRPDGSPVSIAAPSFDAVKETVPEPYCNPRNTPLLAVIEVKNESLELVLRSGKK